MLTKYKLIRYYALFLLLLLSLFSWASLTGTRLLGDDSERVEKREGYSSGRTGGSHRTRHGFYHK